VAFSGNSGKVWHLVALKVTRLKAASLGESRLITLCGRWVKHCCTKIKRLFEGRLLCACPGTSAMASYIVDGGQPMTIWFAILGTWGKAGIIDQIPLVSMLRS
jgi:hypothetical protein